MKIYVLRHGQTDGNVKDMMQGNLDIELNDEGRKQARSAGEIIEKLNIDLIFCSPLKRTVETAKLACPNTPIILDDRLRSRDHGEFEGLRRDEIDRSLYWNIKKQPKYEKAESLQHLFDRVKSLLEEIKEKYQDKNILLVTHSSVTRVLYYYFNGIPEDGDLNAYNAVNAKVESYELKK